MRPEIGTLNATGAVAGATSLGVVNQHNTLWDLLTPADHLALFARLRGVPEPEVRTVVDAALDGEGRARDAPAMAGLDARRHRRELARRRGEALHRLRLVDDEEEPQEPGWFALQGVGEVFELRRVALGPRDTREGRFLFIGANLDPAVVRRAVLGED